MAADGVDWWQGNNVEGAMELMKNSNVKCILGDDLDDAATKVIQYTRKLFS